MRSFRSPEPSRKANGGVPTARIVWLTLPAMIGLIALGIFLKSPVDNSQESDATNRGPSAASATTKPKYVGGSASFPRRPGIDTPQTAEEIVAARLVKFSKIRGKFVDALAKRNHVAVPDEVRRFFEAAASGRWEEIDAAHEALLLTKEQLNEPRSAELHEIWRPIQETWGAAREAHDWPAERLLEYGNAILDSLRPGMIFAGGTDPGCFIPTMLNETQEGERHVVLTQNALADSTYLSYLEFQYGDQINTLTQDDSQQAFQTYIADARKRLEHDQQFPNEPAQIKPGEEVKIVDGRVQVSGQVAVMAINEKLFQTLMAKNPTAAFAMEESFPFNSLYGNATPLGPVIEMGFPDESNPLTSEKAAQSIDYWRRAAEQLLADPNSPDGSDPRKAYSKLISSQAGILAEHQLPAEAEQAFRIASEIYPASPEVTFRYVNLLMGQNRLADAIQVVENALSADPNNEQFASLRNSLTVTSAPK